MQRAAASNSSPTTPNTADLPSAKRQKMQESALATPVLDAQAFQAALAAEESKRAEALDRQAAGAGETKWVLSYQEERQKYDEMGPRITSVGYAGVDGVNGDEREVEEPWRGKMVGRRSFGKFNRALEVRVLLLKTDEQHLCC